MGKLFIKNIYICANLIGPSVVKSTNSGEKYSPELLEALKKGDEQAFDYLFTTHYTDLCRFARAFTGSASSAEDVVQEVFIHIWEKGLKLDKNRSLDSYLYVAVRNGCVSFARKQKEITSLEAVKQRAEEETETDDWKAVWKAVERLPEQCRLILKLVVLEEMKYAEVAEYLELSVNTVKTQIKIAYRELRKEFSRHHLLLFFIFAGKINC